METIKMKKYGVLVLLLVVPGIAFAYTKTTMAPVYKDAAHKSDYDYQDVRARYSQSKTISPREKSQRGVGYTDDAYKGGPRMDQAPHGVTASERLKNEVSAR